METAELARRIQAARGYAQIKRPELARRLGISVSTITRYEDPTNVRHKPNAGMLLAIVSACRVRADWFDESFSLSGRPAADRSSAPGAGGAVGFEPPNLSVVDESEESDRTRA